MYIKCNVHIRDQRTMLLMMMIVVGKYIFNELYHRSSQCPDSVIVFAREMSLFWL